MTERLQASLAAVKLPAPAFSGALGQIPHDMIGHLHDALASFPERYVARGGRVDHDIVADQDSKSINQSLPPVALEKRQILAHEIVSRFLKPSGRSRSLGGMIHGGRNPFFQIFVFRHAMRTSPTAIRRSPLELILRRA